MKYLLGVVLATGLLTSVAIAETTSPSSVKFSDDGVMASLTGKPGDAKTGRSVFANRKLGNCLACHINSEMSEESFHGEVGPPMDGVADRWSEQELRAIVTNSKMIFEGTVMPAFYIDAGYGRPLKKFAGKSILSAEQVEDVIAYLLTLKEE